MGIIKKVTDVFPVIVPAFMFPIKEPHSNLHHSSV